MKCARCDRDSTYSERKDRRCPGCGGEFAFEPREGDKSTDRAFHNAIQRVSAHGEVSWDVENLYYALARRRTTGPLPGFVTVIGVTLIWFTFLRFGVSLQVILLIAVLAPTLANVWASPRWKEPGLSREAFETLWQRWLQVHGTPSRLITQQSPTAQNTALAPASAGAPRDRVIVCDRARTVDLLHANNVHVEHACVVLDASGDPTRAFELLRELLRNNLRLGVYVVHDATPSGCELAHRIAKEQSSSGGMRPVVDIGLRPRHASRHQGAWRRTSPPQLDTSALQALTHKERTWLADGWTLELAAIRPEQLLERLAAVISADRAQSAHSAVVLLDTKTFDPDVDD